ncbi:MCE family protein, partial [bacterium]|nr:MCE family protein [bacterium]
LDGGISFTNTEIEGNKRDPAPQAHNFTVHESYQAAIEKVPALQAQGLSIQVTAPDAKNFSVGSPVLYRLMEVGEITGFTLEEGGENVLVDLLIAKKHAHLVQSSSRFHNLSGITIEGGISSGLAIKTGSLKSIVAGGIAFFTPEPGEAAASGQQYPLYSSHKAAQEIDKQPITIKFAEFQGLNDGIKIRYQGLVVGSVKKVDFTKDMNALLCRTLIDKQAAKLFTTDAKIWLVTPEISLAGINNLDTVISGPYITLQPGTGNPATEFTALTKPPVLDSVATGLSIVIEANLLGSLTKNSPLYYRQIKIGKVTGAKLSSTSQKVLIHVNIEPPYDRLVRSNSKFWNSSGINVKAGIFSGIKITTESMEAIIIGGVSLATPEGEAMGTKVSDGHLFPLHDELNESWLKWQPTINLD